MNIEEFLNMQRQLQINMKEANPTQGGDPFEMNVEELAQFITWNHSAVIVELGEMLDEVGWKPWASSRHIDGPAAMNEMVDAWHFFLNIMLAIAAWSSQVESGSGRITTRYVGQYFENYYRQKNAKNLQRQVDGYDGVTSKCPNCKRELTETHSDAHTEAFGLKFCCRSCAVEYNPKGEVMSNHDPDEVAAISREIEEKSRAQPGSGSDEDLRARAEVEHAARQAAAGYSPSRPTPATPAPRGTTEAQAALKKLVPNVSRIGGKAEKIIREVAETGEPIFILRAKDIFSIMGVAHYIDMLEKYGPESHDMVIGATEQLNIMKAWQVDNIDKVRYPN